METSKIIEMVSQLNELFGYPEHDDETLYFEFCSEGNYGIINFLGNRIWSSVDDERNFFDAINDYEPLETFIKNKAYDFIQKLNQTNFMIERKYRC